MMSCMYAGYGWYENLVPEDLLDFLVHLSTNQNITTNDQNPFHLRQPLNTLGKGIHP